MSHYHDILDRGEYRGILDLDEFWEE